MGYSTKITVGTVFRRSIYVIQRFLASFVLASMVVGAEPIFDLPSRRRKYLLVLI